MIEPKYLEQLCKRLEKHIFLIEREYKKKNIEHRVREDFGYAYSKGKLNAYRYILKELGY